jgi:hypothetical protein
LSLPLTAGTNPEDASGNLFFSIVQSFKDRKPARVTSLGRAFSPVISALGKVALASKQNRPYHLLQSAGDRAMWNNQPTAKCTA